MITHLCPLSSSHALSNSHTEAQLLKHPPTMELLVPCNSSNFMSPKPKLGWKTMASKRTSNRLSSLKLRCEATSSELQSPAGVSVSSESYSVPTIASHKVTVHDRERGVVHEFVVPEDQYILHTAEAQNISLPFACRHGCCTSCAVRIKSGTIRQPEALGISAELREKGYALLCVGYPSSDIEVETQDEDEVYWLQFGRYFARGPIERDDYALELAMGDE